MLAQAAITALEVLEDNPGRCQLLCGSISLDHHLVQIRAKLLMKKKTNNPVLSKP